MDESTFMEILNEIDAMTPKEYWDLFNESQKLPDWPTDWEPIPSPVILDEIVMDNNIYSPIKPNGQFMTAQGSNYSNEGDIICLQVA
ncbi:MAG: hypothetical protein LBB78_07105 [Spirochaetaceae bacterium]|jgi:hypothetical protein|nr:hypothetical protein [Spirochaetaceae bacterium]